MLIWCYLASFHQYKANMCEHLKQSNLIIIFTGKVNCVSNMQFLIVFTLLFLLSNVGFSYLSWFRSTNVTKMIGIDPEFFCNALNQYVNQIPTSWANLITFFCNFNQEKSYTIFAMSHFKHPSLMTDSRATNLLSQRWRTWSWRHHTSI